jgi:hypothetical protein
VTDKERLIAELTTFSFFKDNPEISEHIIGPLRPGTRHHTRARSLAKKVRDSTREFSRAPLDPFGRLVQAIERHLPALREIEDAINPNDILLQLRFALSLVLRSISRIEERFVARDFGADFDEIARTVIYLPPAAEFIATSRTVGYKVHVDGVREAQEKILEVSKGRSADDARVAVASAFLHLLTTLLWPVHRHLAEGKAGTLLHFYFDEDPATYCYLEERHGHGAGEGAR